MRIFALFIISLAGAVALPAETLTKNWELSHFSDHPERLTFQARARPGAFNKTSVLIKHHDADIFNGEMVSLFMETPRGIVLASEITLEKTSRGYLYIPHVVWNEKGRKLSVKEKRNLLHNIMMSIGEWPNELDRAKLWPFLFEIQ